MKIKFSRLKRLLQNLALSVASLMICAVLLETTLRFCGYGNLEIYEPDPVLYWKLKANQDCYTKVGHKPVHINSHGTRGPEFPTTKPPNSVRVLCLGDSRTFGWGLSGPETYSAVLGGLLQQHFGAARKIEVINAGVNAWSYAQMRAYFRDRGLSQEPDFVVLGGANAWTQFSERSSPEFVRKFMSRVRLKNFLRRFAIYHFIVEIELQEVYHRYRTRFIPVDPSRDALFKEQQQKDPDAFFRAEIQGLCLFAVEKKIKPVLLYLPTLDEMNSTNISRDLKAKIAVSREANIPLIDFTPDLAPRGKSLYLDGDPVHLNAEGNEIIARRLFASMTNWVSP